MPGNPRAEDSSSFSGDSYNGTAVGQPGLWCDWVPCWDGCCLAYNGVEKFYNPVAWLRFLINHFLKPGAHASTSDDPLFQHFTFDHVLDGTVVGCRRDNKELFAITVVHNLVQEGIIRPADPRYVDYPPLPYEEVIDRDLSPRQQRRRDEAGAQVLPFPERERLAGGPVPTTTWPTTPRAGTRRPCPRAKSGSADANRSRPTSRCGQYVALRRHLR